MNDFFDDLEKVESRRREFDYKDKDYILEATDPYGFWIVYEKQGNKEILLPGQFTTQADAKEAIKLYADKPKATSVDSKKEKK